MTIALEDRILADRSADGGAAAAGTVVATALDNAVSSAAECAPLASKGHSRGDRRFSVGQWAKATCLPQRGRWIAIIAVATLTAAVVLSDWSALTKIELQAASNGLALAKMRCGDVAQRASSLRTL